MNHGVNMDMTSKCFPAEDRNFGTQYFTIDETQVPLEFHDRKSNVKISKPTQEDHDALPAHELTPSYAFIPN